ncbi:TonB-linked outer membrane protein, SusC/RagA family [uncultured Paludibacter sp.]|uniref:TonB-linked outer membrane protein, SusC/RagA family n=1 Tax=uncultured Paludibacter sp. TaxID=497635 RepID=A0A653A6Z5_9BACT|nr:TonB-linked outer membrane protein, SusC/RagA family [uncultured Paludibacter sp.]
MKNKRMTFSLLIFLSFTTIFAQELKIQGIVTDKKTGETLIGANVLQKGTTNGTLTSFDGNFTISVPPGSTLLISYVGYEPQEVLIKSDAPLSIALSTNEKILEEVVVVGYGTKKAGAVTGSVVQVKSEDILKTPANSAIQSIQGKAAGVNIIATDEPGKSPTVMIRGINTVLGGGTPLFVIDGIEATSLNGLSSNDIETIDVLKDASSLAIYGNKGASGVILVTTKKGNIGKIKINYDGYVGFKGMMKTVDMADTYHFVYYQNFAAGRMRFAENQPYDTNWLKEITRTGMTTNNALSLSGGTENINYYFGVTHYTEKGILKGTDYNRTNFINKNEYKLFNNKLKIVQSFNIAVINNVPQPLSAFTAAYKQAPIMPVKYEDGKWGMPFIDADGVMTEVGDKFNNVPNPVAMLDYDIVKNRNITFFGTLGGEFQLLKDLKFTSTYGATIDWGAGYTYTPNEINWFSQNPTAAVFPNKYYSTLTQSRSNFYVWNWDNYFTYNKNFDEHGITAVLGVTRSTARTTQYLSATRYNVPAQSNYWTLNLSKNDDKTAPSSLISNWNETPLVNLGYFGRIDYDYNRKYLLTASLRRDGISDFQGSQKWGMFPAISAGWIVSSESFFEKYTQIFDYLKLKIGYGEIGNGNACPSVNQVLFNNGATYPFGTSEIISPGSYVPYAVDPNLTWETTKELGGGVEFRVLKQRLFGTIELYRKLTDNVILPVKLPPVLSPGDVYLNAGKVENKGIETMLTWDDKIGDEFKYKVGVNFAYNKNAVINIYSPYFDKLTGGDLGNGHYTKEVHVGDPIGSFYVYKVTGYTIDGSFAYSDSRINSGSYIPKVTYGFNLGFDFKGFDFTTELYGVAGNKVYNGKKAQRWGGENVEMNELHDFWTPGNPSQTAKNPRPYSDTPWPSTYFVESGAYLRINNITLGYTLPKILKDIEQIRVFVTAVNPFIFTPYTGFSPELTGSGSPLGSAGIELDAYPTNKSLTMGVNINL